MTERNIGPEVGAAIREAAERMHALEAENRRLRMALEFYAERGNWRVIVGSDLDTEYSVIDGGRAAREALAAAASEPDAAEGAQQ